MNLIQQYAHNNTLSDASLAKLVARLPAGFTRADVFVPGRTDNTYTPCVGDIVVDAIHGDRGIFVIDESGSLAVRSGPVIAREYRQTGFCSAFSPG